MTRFNPLDHPITAAIPIRLAPSTWFEHIPFAMYLVDVLRPQLFVELGTFYGVSYCAFCQAVDQLNLSTRCYAIDTWRGDPQSGSYGDDVLIDLKSHHDPLYSEFSQLIHREFPDAAELFAENSIDLLHIDGCHTFEAVKQDFETWLPKMSDRGVMLFHDIAVRDDDFGVWRLWDQLKPEYPNYQVEFGYGLGLIATGPNYPKTLEPLFSSSSEDLDQIRQYFQQLGKHILMFWDLHSLQGSVKESEAATRQRYKRMRSAHPLLTRASNFLEVSADEGITSAVRLAKSRLLNRSATADQDSTQQTTEEVSPSHDG